MAQGPASKLKSQPTDRIRSRRSTTLPIAAAALLASYPAIDVVASVAGLAFLASSGMDDAQLAGIGGYMALGAVLVPALGPRQPDGPHAAPITDKHQPNHRRTMTMSFRSVHRVSALLALATAGLGSFALAASADARATPAKPTVVLVHGAFADASGFAAVIDRLRDDGYPVRAAPNPLLGLPEDAATVRGFLDSIKGPKIVVGHSYGGAVITQAASGDADVKALVYLAALAPDRGEVLGELFETPVAHPPAPMPLIPVTVTQPDGTARTDLYLDPSKFRERFAADVPPRVADDLAASQRPLSKAAFTSALSVEPAWKTIPSWYLVSKQDSVMAPELERLLARRMHAHTSQVDSSHAVYISHPGAVADLVKQAARATR